MTANPVFFVKTVKVGGYIRLRALPNQIDSDGIPIDTEKNVRCSDAAIRERYPLGTIFSTRRLEISDTATRVSYYLSGHLYPINCSKELVQSFGDILPSPAARYSFDLYCKQNALSETSTDASSSQASENPESQSTQQESAVVNTMPGVSFLEAIRRDPSLAVPTINKDGFYVKEKDWFLLVRNIQKSISTMLVGQTGTGKTELIRLACKKLNLPCRVYDMGSMHDPLSQLLGVHRLKEGQSVFEYARFAQDVQQPGVVVLDELSRAPLGTSNILFSCLDSQRTLHIEMAGGDGLRSVPVHPQCVFIATANVGAEYTGTFSMDRALISRFFPLEFGYLQKAEEILLLMKRFGISRADADNIVSVADTVRNLYKNQDISCTVSTRETLSAASLVADGWSAIDALELTFLPLFEGTNTEGERSVVSKIFLTR